MPENDTTESRGIQSVDRAMALLLELGLVSRDVDLAELARRTGLTKSTASRLLSTMHKRGLVRQDPLTRRFSLGTEFIRLGNVALAQIWRPESFHAFLERLARETGETASLAVREATKAVYVDQVSSKNMIRSFPPIGAKVYLHCTAVGKVLLSGLTREKVLQIIDTAGLPAYTASTITDPAALFAELEGTRTTGYALDDEETEIGGRCLAAPVRDYNGETIAAISVSGPAIRVSPERFAGLASVLHAVAAEISSQFGYKDEMGRSSK